MVFSARTLVAASQSPTTDAWHALLCAETAIRKCPPEMWIPLLIGIVEGFDSEDPGDDTFVREVVKALTQRLELGRW